MDVPDEIKDLIPPEGEQVGPLFYGATPESIQVITRVAVEAFKRGKEVKNGR